MKLKLNNVNLISILKFNTIIMKKVIVLLAMSILLVSCGDIVENENVDTVVTEPVVVENVVVEEELVEELSEEEIDAALEELFEWLED